MSRRLALVLTIVAAVALPLAGRAEAAPLTGATSMASMDNHTCVRLSSGQARCWGANYDGEMGDGSDGEPIADVRTVKAPAGTGPLTAVTQMAVGYYHSCALLQSGQARCWGYAEEGQLGDGSAGDSRARARVVKNRFGTGPLEGAIQITAGERHSCVVIESRQVRCWGQNIYGELGIGSIGATENPLPKVVRNVADNGPLTGVAQVDGGRNFTCARLTNGQVRCWGDNDHGQLGDGTADPSSTPVVVRLEGGTPLTGVTQLSAGEEHVCVRLSSGQARCWGAGGNGRLGNGSATPYPNPHVVTATNGGPPLTGVSQIDAGGAHTCARMANGQARCWGEAGSGQLGWNDPVDSYIPQTVVNPAGTGQLQGVRQVRTGSAFSCAVLQTGQARCWGGNDNGQLGDGDPGTDRLKPRIVVL